MKILTDISTGGYCKCNSVFLKKYSRHDITFADAEDVPKYDFKDFDILHMHGRVHDEFFTTKTKIIYGVHVFLLSCPSGGLFCSVLNKFLNEPLTCLNCLGYVGMKTGETNLKKYIRTAKIAKAITVESEFMREFYHAYNPMILPVPLETDILMPYHDKEDYLLYSGRLSFEKNPYGFIDIVNKTGMKGKMMVYSFLENDQITNSNRFYKDIIENKNKNIEVILNPSKEHMIELVKHAKFMVLPYFFAEPFGIAATNSILCGTPLVAFPYGNVRNMTHLLPKTLDEMIQMMKMDDTQYQMELDKVLIKSNELRITHEPQNVVRKWDDLYDEIGEPCE